jgi:hypothetical protein
MVRKEEAPLMKPQDPYAVPVANTGNEEIPPGVRTRAIHRPENEEHGPGEGGGPRHATNDAGSPDEEYGAVDSNEPLAEPETEEEPEGPPYAGHGGGAIGGTPANKRATEGHQRS